MKIAKIVKKIKESPFFYSSLFFFVGVLLTMTVQRVLADSNTINACVGNVTGIVRIITGSQTCNTHLEQPISWNIQGPAGPQGPAGSTGSTYFGLPFLCSNLRMQPYAAKFVNQDFSNASLSGCNFSSVDIHGVIFKGGTVLNNTSFDGADLTNADLSNITGITGPMSGSFNQANLTNVNFTNTQIDVQLKSANLQNTNFTNVQFTNANLSGATNMGSANLTGVTWANTICPDGTNSDSNGSTCVGHF